jgi:hypothetical protein
MSLACRGGRRSAFCHTSPRSSSSSSKASSAAPPVTTTATNLKVAYRPIARENLKQLQRHYPQAFRHMLVFQQRVAQQQLPPSQRSKPNPTPKRVQGRQGHYAAAAAVVMFACSVAAAHAAQQVAASYPLGTWSTAALSVARTGLGATSLPNHGVAIFAGGYSMCRHVDFRIL